MQPMALTDQRAPDPHNHPPSLLDFRVTREISARWREEDKRRVELQQRINLAAWAVTIYGAGCLTVLFVWACSAGWI